MSLDTWKAEFYPTEASEAAGSDLEATRHSLRKWEGLRTDALAKHGMVRYGLVGISGRECALCQRYILRHPDMECTGCPLAATTGMTCDEGDEGDDAYSVFTRTGNAEPLIAALRATLARLEAKPTLPEGM